MYGIREIMRSCCETASSKSLVDDTSSDFAVAFLMPPMNFSALETVRQADC